MRLCFLQERQYAPYEKWFGTAFQQLEASAELLGVLEAAMNASTWRGREAALSKAYEALARRHNALGITATSSRSAPIEAAKTPRSSSTFSTHSSHGDPASCQLDVYS